MRRPTPAETSYWKARLRESGFDDIENADGSLRDERSRHDVGYNRELNDRTDSGGCGLAIETIADKYRCALYRYPFSSGLDREICAALAGGTPIRAAIDALGVGQHRVYRVIEAIRAWRDPGETLFGAEIPGTPEGVPYANDN